MKKYTIILTGTVDPDFRTVESLHATLASAVADGDGLRANPTCSSAPVIVLRFAGASRISFIRDAIGWRRCNWTLHLASWCSRHCTWKPEGVYLRRHCGPRRTRPPASARPTCTSSDIRHDLG
jgi:hypothetical protein